MSKPKTHFETSFNIDCSKPNFMDEALGAVRQALAVGSAIGSGNISFKIRWSQEAKTDIQSENQQRAFSLLKKANEGSALELARKIGISTSHISKLAASHAPLTRRTLEKIEEAGKSGRIILTPEVLELLRSSI